HVDLADPRRARDPVHRPLVPHHRDLTNRHRSLPSKLRCRPSRTRSRIRTGPPAAPAGAASSLPAPARGSETGASRSGGNGALPDWVGAVVWSAVFSNATVATDFRAGTRSRAEVDN